MTKQLRTTAATIKAGTYSFAALIGVILAALPDIITSLTTDPDAPTLPKWAVWSVRVVGLIVAAQGKPLVVRE